MTSIRHASPDPEIAVRHTAASPACLAGLWLLTALSAVAGCGTTRSSDTPRTATEQLLLSTAIDKAINRLDFHTLAEKRVYFDPQYLAGVTDERYVVSSMRQHLLASGCVLCEQRDEADYIVEARSGAVGTDRNEVMLGLPTMQMPGVVPGVPVGLPATTVPQMTLAKKTKQRAVAKIGVFAYNRHTGRPVWQSGAPPMIADSRDTWLLGAGPIHGGSFAGGRTIDGDELQLPETKRRRHRHRGVQTHEETFFSDQPAVPAIPPDPAAAPTEATPTPMPNQAARITDGSEPPGS